ncbi:MAG: ABC transporter permease [Anaerolineales bacterium]|nr:ABC transporter permease [Anaerolineales bacterium]
MKTRVRKIFGDILARRGRTALVSISIMIGVFGVSTLVGMSDLVVSQLSSDLDKDHIAMTHAYVVAPGGRISAEENETYLQTLSDLPGVLQVEGQAVYLVDWKTDSDAKFTSGNIIAYSEPFGDVDLEPIARVVDGRYPVEGQHEVAVEQRFAEKYDVGIGDKLIFRQATASDDPEQTWEVVGVVFHPYFTVSVALENNAEPENNIYATYADAQAIAGFPGLSSFYARYTDVKTAKADLNHFFEVISTETPYIPVFSFMDDPNDSYILGVVSSFINVLNILAAIAMLVSGFLVTNVINTIVVEQKTQIGVMKSLGASRWDSVYIYAGMALLYGAVGTIVGVLLSIPVAAWMAQELAPLALTYIEDFRISALGIGVGVALGLLIPVLAALLPVFNGTRVSILDAMTDLGIASNWGHSRLSHWIGAWPLPINIRQAFSNIIQKRGRLALTGFTLMLAVAAFMGVTAVFSTLNDQMKGLYDTFDYDIEVSPQEAQDFDTVQSLLVNQYPEIEAIYPGYSVSVGIEGYASEEAFTKGSNQLNVTGIDPASPAIQFDLVEGDGWKNDPTREGTIITKSLADRIDKTVGDTVVITVGGQSYEYEIIGIDSFPFDQMFFNWQDLASRAGYVDANGEPLAGAFLVKMTGDPDIEAVDDTIESMKEFLLTQGIQANYTNQPKAAEENAEQIGMFGMIFNMSSFVMAAVGAIGLLATLSMSVFERQKEIGVMRSIGAGSATVTTQFLVEGILVGLIAWVVALPVSVVIGQILSGALDFGTGFSFEYPPQIAVMGLIGILLVATLASIWPSLSAARKTVSDILRYQ